MTTPFVRAFEFSRIGRALSLRRLLVAYALVNALLYSTLLPLWEGFDEPFHFGYVQQLSNGQGLPDPRTSRLSEEVGTSLLLAPGSDAVRANLPQVTSYAEYFSWPEDRRRDVRRRLFAIPPEARRRASEFMNYEAQHPPLAYAFLALPERVLDRVPLPVRVAILRVIAAAAGSLLLIGGAERLFTLLEIHGPLRSAALFCLLSSQMIWATLAHIGNDWLAVPLAVWTLVTLIRLDSRPEFRNAVYAGICLACGLLTKAYFLAFVPLLAGLCTQRKRSREAAIALLVTAGIAGPWYLRNLVHYGVWTGTQQAREGIGPGEVLRAAPGMNWSAFVVSTVRTSLWTGNNTFRTLSAGTLSVIAGAMLIGLLLWAVSGKTRAEWLTFWFCFLFAIALGYDALARNAASGGAANATSPWYAQAILAPVLGLTFRGASRFRRLGRADSTLLILVFGYVMAITYAVKLIPLYAGYEGRTSFSTITMLYTHRLPAIAANLDTVCLAPASVIFTLTGMVIVLVGWQLVLLIRGGAGVFAAGSRSDGETGRGRRPLSYRPASRHARSRASQPDLF